MSSKIESFRAYPWVTSPPPSSFSLSAAEALKLGRAASRKFSDSSLAAEVPASPALLDNAGEPSMTRLGLEPRAYGLKVRCSTN